ncbi:MAG: FecR domain-containing protein [Candidatus Omnitrophica bacterium]|nr:FecR domain-containing protein [Candidatus Omnitrophota bacterium]
MTEMRRIARMAQGFLVVAVCGVFAATAAQGEDYSGEVMTVRGTAYVLNEDSGQRPLNQGDLVKAGDRIEVGQSSHVDIAFDKEWNNIARVGEKSTAEIRSVYPTGIGLPEGDIFAKLHKLPKGTTFEIQTPVAVAAVRGSEYWTEHRDGATKVLNFSPSPVEVFALSDKGDLIGRTIVQQTERTEIRMMNEPPAPPQKMDADDLVRAVEHSTGIDLSVREVVEEGRVGKVQDVDSVTEKLKARSEEMASGHREREEAGTTDDRQKENLKEENEKGADKRKEIAKDDAPKDRGPREDGPEDKGPREDDPKGRGPEDNEPRVKVEEPKVKVEEPKIKVEEPKIKVEEPKIKVEEPKIKVEEPKIKIDEPKIKVDEPKIRVDEPKIRVDEPKIRVDEPKIRIEEPKIRVDEPKIRIEEPRVRAEKIEDRDHRDGDRDREHQEKGRHRGRD